MVSFVMVSEDTCTLPALPVNLTQGVSTHIRKPAIFFMLASDQIHIVPDSKIDGTNMGQIWGRQDSGGPHVGPINFALWGVPFCNQYISNFRFVSGQSFNNKSLPYVWHLPLYSIWANQLFHRKASIRSQIKYLFHAMALCQVGQW